MRVLCPTALEGLLKAVQQLPSPLDVHFEPHDDVVRENFAVLQTDSVVVDQFLGDLDVFANEATRVGPLLLVHGASFLAAAGIVGE